MKYNYKIDAVLKVQLALNYLKLCADHENPTGSGVPVDIVTMPDFVVDIDGYALTQLNNGKFMERLASAEVGSRAGRILSILAHLRDLDDEGFGLHYIAKTGDVGHAVLNKRLNTDLREKHLQPLRFPLLLSAKDTRYSILGRRERKFTEQQVVKNEAYLTCDDLTCHFYNPINIITNAAAVYFGADSSDQFAELLDLVVRGLSEKQSSSDSNQMKPDRYVFIDLSAIKDNTDRAEDAYRKTIEQLTDARKTNNTSYPAALNTRLIVIVKSDNRPIEEHWRRLGLQDKTDTLLVYDDKNNEMCIADSEHGRLPVVPIVYDQRPGGRDAFIAGLMLHRAIAAAWKRIPIVEQMKHVSLADDAEAIIWRSNWTQGLFPNPYNNAEIDRWPLSESVAFGEALVALWGKETDTIPDRRNLFFENLGSPEQHKWGKESNDIESNIKNMVEVVRSYSIKSKPSDFFAKTTLLSKLARGCGS